MTHKKKFGKSLIAALAALLAFGSFSAVYAENRTSDDYNPNETGTITLYKYVNNDGKSTITNGEAFSTNPDEQLDAIEEATGSYNMIPEEGVEFKYLKVADFTQYDDPKTKQTGTYFTNFDNSFLNLFKTYNVALNSAAETATADNGKAANKKHYTTDSVYKAMENLNKTFNASKTGEEALRELASNKGTAFEPTNMFGRTKSEELPLGLYLVAEVNWEHQTLAKHDTYWIRTDGTEDAGDGSDTADIVSPSSPFVVHLPIAVEDKWLYDVTAYPKNGTLNIHKDILIENYANINGILDTDETETLCDYRQLNYNKAEGGEYYAGENDTTKLDGPIPYTRTHQRDANIGDIVNQLISSDVPALVGAKKNRVYKITDHMTTGLRFNRIKSVKLTTGDHTSAGTTLNSGEHYNLSVNDDGTAFTVELTAAGLTLLDNIQSASYLYIDFDATVTKDALIGTDTAPFITNDGNTVDATNQNTAMLTYATDRTSEHDYYSNTCRIYTYEIDLKKTLNEKIHGAEDKSALDLPLDYSKVKFTVQGERKANGAAAANEFADVIFYKEGDGVYHVYDPVTDGGTYNATADTLENPQTITRYISPKSDDGTLAVKGVDSRDYIFTEVATAEGYQLLEQPFTVRLVAALVDESMGTKYENGSLSHAYVWSGDEPGDLRDYDLAKTDAISQLNTGRVPVGIANASVFHVLRTGGTGTVMFVVGGLALLLGAGFWFMKMNSKKSDQDEEEEAKDE